MLRSILSHVVYGVQGVVFVTLSATLSGSMALCDKILSLLAPPPVELPKVNGTAVMVIPHPDGRTIHYDNLGMLNCQLTMSKVEPSEDYTDRLKVKGIIKLDKPLPIWLHLCSAYHPESDTLVITLSDVYNPRLVVLDAFFPSGCSICGENIFPVLEFHFMQSFSTEDVNTTLSDWYNKGKTWKEQSWEDLKSKILPKLEGHSLSLERESSFFIDLQDFSDIQ